MELIAQGAEARMYKHMIFGRACIVKERFTKEYRHPSLDEKLTVRRTHQEARALLRCRELGIPTPAVFLVDSSHNRLYLEYLTNTTTVKQYIIDTLDQPDGHTKLAEDIGVVLGNLHNNNIIHGDLTTSNFLRDRDTGTIYVIDFGLSMTSSLLEDKGVDLYVLERAFKSTHPTADYIFDMIIQSYARASKQSTAIIKKYEEVRARGRKRSMLG